MTWRGVNILLPRQIQQAAIHWCLVRQVSRAEGRSVEVLTGEQQVLYGSFVSSVPEGKQSRNFCAEKSE